MIRGGKFCAVCLPALVIGLMAPSFALAKAPHKAPAPAAAAAADAFAKATAGMTRTDGLLPVYVDKVEGKVLIALPAADADGLSGKFIYQTMLKTGLGSAPLALDRSQPGETQIIHFRRIGKKVLAEYENTKFRATNAPAPEQAAARDSFAYSTVWAGDVVATAPDGRVLVDITSFLTRDSMDIAASLKTGGETDWRQAGDLSVADAGATKVFPENLEFEARETFTTDTTSAETANIAPNAKSLSFVVRHSLIKLPEAGYQPRPFDPRTSPFTTQVVDYAAPLGKPVVYELADRFRLEKINPGPAPSRVKKPIVFYVDRSAPEPIRSALVEGAGWWSKAFEDAGYIDAFRVEVMPEGVDPLDARYNVINWVNRATRGWSYGGGVIDPRTGEIIKGYVLLGSLRIRQDMLIFEGLAGADKDNTGAQDDPVRISLARIRQLGAHETGHALGFQHNFAGSTQDRTSVMDYPGPRIAITADNKLDFSDAYARGVGSWDKYSIDWLYGDVPAGDAGAAALRAKAQAGEDQNRRYISDADARPLGAAQPWASLWDDGPDAAAELTRMMRVRRIALDNFGLRALAPNEAMSDLRRKYVPVYLLHRYEIDAAAKIVGGVDYTYTVAGSGHEVSATEPVAHQKQALDALLGTLNPAELDTPERLSPLMSSAYSGQSDRQYDIEVFKTQGGPVFDPLVAADVAGSLTINALLAPDRLNRLEDQQRRDASQLGAADVVDALIGATFDAKGAESGRLADIRRRIETRVVVSLAEAQRDPSLSPTVAAIISQRLADLGARMKAGKGADALERAHQRRIAELAGGGSALETAMKPAQKPTVPPGMPIGGDEDDWFSDLF